MIGKQGKSVSILKCIAILTFIITISATNTAFGYQLHPTIYKKSTLRPQSSRSSASLSLELDLSATGGLIGKLYDNPYPKTRKFVTRDIIGREEKDKTTSKKYLAFYMVDPKSAPRQRKLRRLYTKDCKVARVEIIDVDPARKITVLADNECIKAFGAPNMRYICQAFLKEGVVLYHEELEAYYIQHPEKLPPGVNAHTFLRGCGKAIRKLIMRAIASGALDKNCKAGDVIKYIKRAFIKGDLPISRYNPAEIAFIRHNQHNKNLFLRDENGKAVEDQVTGECLLLGQQEQDPRLGRAANKRLSEIINPEAAIPDAVLTRGSVDNFMNFENHNSGSHMLAEQLMRFLESNNVIAPGGGKHGQAVEGKIKGACEETIQQRPGTLFRRKTTGFGLKKARAKAEDKGVFIFVRGNVVEIIAGELKPIIEQLQDGKRRENISEGLYFSFSIHFDIKNNFISITRPFINKANKDLLKDTDIEDVILQSFSSVIAVPNAGLARVPVRALVNRLADMKWFLRVCASKADIDRDAVGMPAEITWFFAMREAGILNDVQLRKLVSLYSETHDAFKERALDNLTGEGRTGFEAFRGEFINGVNEMAAFVNDYFSMRQHKNFAEALMNIFYESQKQDEYNGFTAAYVFNKFITCGTYEHVLTRLQKLDNQIANIAVLQQALRDVAGEAVKLDKQGLVQEIAGIESALAGSDIAPVQKEAYQGQLAQLTEIQTIEQRISDEEEELQARQKQEQRTPDQAPGALQRKHNGKKQRLNERLQPLQEISDVKKQIYVAQKESQELEATRSQVREDLNEQFHHPEKLADPRIQKILRQLQALYKQHNITPMSQEDYVLELNELNAKLEGAVAAVKNETERKLNEFDKDYRQRLNTYEQTRETRLKAAGEPYEQAHTDGDGKKMRAEAKKKAKERKEILGERKEMQKDHERRREMLLSKLEDSNTNEIGRIRGDLEKLKLQYEQRPMPDNEYERQAMLLNATLEREYQRLRDTIQKQWQVFEGRYNRRKLCLSALLKRAGNLLDAKMQVQAIEKASQDLETRYRKKQIVEQECRTTQKTLREQLRQQQRIVNEHKNWWVKDAAFVDVLTRYREWLSNVYVSPQIQQQIREVKAQLQELTVWYEGQRQALNQRLNLAQIDAVKTTITQQIEALDNQYQTQRKYLMSQVVVSGDILYQVTGGFVMQGLISTPAQFTKDFPCADTSCPRGYSGPPKNNRVFPKACPEDLNSDGNRHILLTIRRQA